MKNHQLHMSRFEINLQKNACIRWHRLNTVVHGPELAWIHSFFDSCLLVEESCEDSIAEMPTTMGEASLILEKGTTLPKESAEVDRSLAFSKKLVLLFDGPSV